MAQKTKLVDALKLQKGVTSIIAFEFTEYAYFAVGYESGEMSVFDARTFDIAEEIKLLNEPLDLIIECHENPKLRGCLILASHQSATIRVVCFKV